jgi:hypothetical protein
MRPPTFSRTGGIAGALLLILAVLAGCAAAGTSPAVDEGRGAVGGGVEQPAASVPAGAGPVPGRGSNGEAVPIEQRIIKTGEVGIEVDNVATVLARVRAIALELGGYVGGSQAGTLEESATLTVRVPAARFDELLARLHELEDTEVISEATREEDVTRQIVDLEARIRNLQASEASYRALVERAERIEDILAVQTRLDEVRGQIEQLQGQLETVSGQADLSTLTVTLVPRDQPIEQTQEGWDPGGELSRAVAALVGLGQGILNVLIWFGIVWVPVLLVVGVIVLIGFRLLGEVRRRLPATPEPERPA